MSVAEPEARRILKIDSVWKRFHREFAPARRQGVLDILSEFRHRREIGAPDLRPGEFWALQDINFEVNAGEAMGVVGLNGSGKSTLLRLLHGLAKPDAGRITVDGSSAALIELGASFAGALTGRENVVAEATLLGVSSERMEDLVDRVADFADIGTFLDVPVDKYSSGMRMRLAYAISVQMRPDLLIIDEVIAVGDLATQRKCVLHIHEFLAGGGALVLVTHDLWMFNAVCTKAIQLDKGRIIASGSIRDVMFNYVEGLRSHAVTEFDNSFDNDPTVPLGERNGGLPSIPGSLDVDAESTDPSLAELSIESIIVTTLDDDRPLQLGEPVEVVVEIVASHEIGPVTWSFAVMSANQETCVAVSPSGSPGLVAFVDEGRNRLACTIDYWPLTGGVYLLRAAIVDAGGAVLATRGVEDVYPLRVEMSEDPRELIGQIIACLSIGEATVHLMTSGPVPSNP